MATKQERTPTQTLFQWLPDWAARSAIGTRSKRFEAIREQMSKVTKLTCEAQLVELFMPPSAVDISEPEHAGPGYTGLVDERQREIENLRLQVERLKSLATQERRVAAHESQRCDELLRQLDGLRKNYDQLTKAIERLTSIHRACEYRTVSKRRFDRLAESWKEETGHLSNITKKCTHPAYQEIIGLGMGAVPLILCDLKSSHDDWFWALSAITGENPISENDAGKVNKMTEAWLLWGKAKGYDI